MDHYRIPLPNGRSASVSADQVAQIATGLGIDVPARNDLPPVVEALRRLPPDQRADGLSVALMRFADKQDIETISRSCGLETWEVWQLEQALRCALAEVQQPPAGASLSRQLEASDTTRVMSSEMLANALAHGDEVDLDREHEASLRAASEAGK